MHYYPRACITIPCSLHTSSVLHHKPTSGFVSRHGLNRDITRISNVSLDVLIHNPTQFRIVNAHDVGKEVQGRDGFVRDGMSWYVVIDRPPRLIKVFVIEEARLLKRVVRRIACAINSGRILAV
jgi:hypothetical protein